MNRNTTYGILVNDSPAPLMAITVEDYTRLILAEAKHDELAAKLAKAEEQIRQAEDKLSLIPVYEGLAKAWEEKARRLGYQGTAYQEVASNE